MLDFFALPYHVLGEIITCVLSLIILVNIITSFSPYELRHRLFLYAGISTFFSAFSNVFAVICIGYYQTLSISLCTFVSTVYFVFLLLPPLYISLYVCDMALTYSPYRIIVQIFNVAIYVCYLIIILINIKTGWVFRYDAVEGYIRGPLKMITYITTGIYSLIGIGFTVCNKKSLATRLFVVFITYPFISVGILSVQFFLPTVVMTGISSYAALLLAYISIQSDMLDFDLVTGLMTNHKLAQHLELKGKQGVLYVLSIENMNIIQNNIEISEMNKILLLIGKEFSKHFQRTSYHITTSRFAGIASDMDAVIDADKSIQSFIQRLTVQNESHIPVTLDVYCSAIDFSKGDKSSNNIMDLVNDMLRKSVLRQSHKLQICDNQVLKDMERKRTINNILRRELNLDSTQFQVWFQPIYSIKDGKFTYMEALSRLQNTELGNVSPQEFVEVAENRGLIEKLGFVAFEKVCKFIAENKDVVNAVSINFSVYQMSNPYVVANVINAIEKFNLNPASIIMEITESLFIDNYELVSHHMNELSKYGVRFYLDDFGTGYSNLANVISLPFSTIKLDRTLVLMMEEDSNKELFFRNIVETLRGAGKSILVEGVETEKQRATVEKAGADYIQGFFYSRPLPPADCIEFLKNANN